MKRMIFLIAIVAVLILNAAVSTAEVEVGLMRTQPVGSPKKGTLWLSSSSNFASIQTSSFLKNTYGVTDSRISSSMNYGLVGITDWFALSARFPFYADMFKQGSRGGEKTGAGDVGAGFRLTWLPDRYHVRGISFGLSATIPERLGYGGEPLGFRNFSSGELSYSAEASVAFEPKFVRPYLSVAYTRFHNAPNSPKLSGDAFYESSYGLIGIGATGSDGYSNTIFQDQATVYGGFEIPIKSYLSGIIEGGAAFFTEKPTRSSIVSIAPGFRFGRQSGINASIGMDFRINGAIPERAYLFRLTVPFISPTRLIRKPAVIVEEEPMPKEMVRSRNSLVAVNDFEKSDQKFLYERDLKEAFRSELSSMGIMDLISDSKVERAYKRADIVPLKDSPERFGIRLGANYVINTDINEYTITREKGFNIPFVVGFPKTTFILKARASVTDLVKGQTRDLGVITATLYKSRGVRMFPIGESGDIVYLSAPERTQMEKEIVNLWVHQFNELILNNIDMFSWEPKRTEIHGDEENEG